MDLLAYWRYDNYLRDLDEGAGFNFNSNQSRLHTAINIGELLWLFTRVVNTGESEYRLLARLNVIAKTINAPNYKCRVPGDYVDTRSRRLLESRRFLHDLILALWRP